MLYVHLCSVELFCFVSCLMLTLLVPMVASVVSGEEQEVSVASVTVVDTALRMVDGSEAGDLACDPLCRGCWQR